MAEADAGRFNVVIVWALDPLRRSMVVNLTTVLKLDAMGVEVISVNEASINMGDPVVSLLIAVFGWVAEQERVRIIERTMAGVERARTKGVRCGRPKAIVDLEAAVRLREDGTTLRGVAKQMDVGTSTLHRLLGQRHGDGLSTPRMDIARILVRKREAGTGRG